MCLHQPGQFHSFSICIVKGNRKVSTRKRITRVCLEETCFAWCWRVVRLSVRGRTGGNIRPTSALANLRINHFERFVMLRMFGNWSSVGANDCQENSPTRGKWQLFRQCHVKMAKTPGKYLSRFRVRLFPFLIYMYYSFYTSIPLTLEFFFLLSFLVPSGERVVKKRYATSSHSWKTPLPATTFMGELSGLIFLLQF